MHTDQHAFRQDGAVWHVRAIADEAAPGDHGGSQRHPAAVNFFVAEQDRVGDEGFVAERQQVRNQALGGRNLGIAPNLGAEQAIPVGGENGRIDAVQHVKAGFLYLIDQPAAVIDFAMHRPTPRFDAR